MPFGTLAFKYISSILNFFVDLANVFPFEYIKNTIIIHALCPSEFWNKIFTHFLPIKNGA
ncbi:MAG: hypothetical protein K2P17_05775 [Helicobacteraceae bacterium]|nr:hypothetical protein [Helicobacteraceae bacterium]